MDKERAIEFFKQLEDFSREYAKQLGVEYPSPWCQDTYDGKDNPRGAIMHYTADMTLEASLRWFSVQKFEAKASAHVLVAPRILGSAAQLAKKYPLVASLPVTVVQVVPPNWKAWHATWVNGWTYGIENVNAGELRKDPSTGKLMHWRPLHPGMPEWSTPWMDTLKEVPIEMAGRFWDNYPTAQLAANIIILRYVNALFGGGVLEPSWILGHEQVQSKFQVRAQDGTPMGSQKRDPGPQFPLNDIREAVLGGEEWYGDFLEQYDANPRYYEKQRDRYVVDAVRALSGAEPSAEVAWTRFDAAVRALPDRAEFGVIGKCALKLLGYNVSNLGTPVLTKDDTDSVWIFQKMMGLKADSQPGHDTKLAIVTRLVDRGFLADHSKAQ